MSYFVRTGTPEGGYLYLGRGKLGAVGHAAPYAHPSAANTAAVNMNKKMAKKGLPGYDFEILPSKHGVPITEAAPFTIEEATKVDPKQPEIMVIPGNQHALVVKLHGEYVVCQKWGSFSDVKQALEYAAQVTEAALE